MNRAALSTTSWQGFIFLPLFIHAWLAAWASLQAFILSTDSGHVKQRFWLSARSANWLFLAGGGILAAAGLVVSILGLLATNHLWSKFVVVRDALETLEAGWTGTLDIAGLLKLTPAFLALEDSASSATHYGLAECSTYAVLCASILIVLLCGIGMAQVLQKNINYHSVGLNKSYEQVSVPLGTTSIGLGGFGTNKHTITRSDVRQLANAQGGPGRDRARLVLQLSKAKLDLLSVSVTLIIAATLAEALLCFTIWKTSTQRNTWALYELSSLGIGWIYPPLMVATLISLFANIFTTTARQQSTSEGSLLPAAATTAPSPRTESEKPVFGSRPVSTVIPILSRIDSTGREVPAEADEFTPTKAAPFGPPPGAKRGIQIGAGAGAGGARSASGPFPSGGRNGDRTGRVSPARGPVGMESFIEMSHATSKADSTEDPHAGLLTPSEEV